MCNFCCTFVARFGMRVYAVCACMLLEMKEPRSEREENKCQNKEKIGKTYSRECHKAWFSSPCHRG